METLQRLKAVSQAIIRKREQCVYHLLCTAFSCVQTLPYICNGKYWNQASELLVLYHLSLDTQMHNMSGENSQTLSNDLATSYNLKNQSV